MIIRHGGAPDPYWLVCTVCSAVLNRGGVAMRVEVIFNLIDYSATFSFYPLPTTLATNMWNWQTPKR